MSSFRNKHVFDCTERFFRSLKPLRQSSTGKSKLSYSFSYKTTWFFTGSNQFYAKKIDVLFSNLRFTSKTSPILCK